MEPQSGLSIGQKFIWGSALLGGFLILLGGAFVDYATILIPIGLILYSVLLHGYMHKCRECSVWWAGILIDKEVVERWQEMKNVQRAEHIRDRNGKVVSTHNRHEQIVVDCQKIRSVFQCKKCGHKWAVVKTKKSDTFLDSINRRFAN
jgi:hypothetical protein